MEEAQKNPILWLNALCSIFFSSFMYGFFFWEIDNVVAENSKKEYSIFSYLPIPILAMSFKKLCFTISTLVTHFQENKYQVLKNLTTFDLFDT